MVSAGRSGCRSEYSVEVKTKCERRLGVEGTVKSMEKRSTVVSRASSSDSSKRAAELGHVGAAPPESRMRRRAERKLRRNEEKTELKILNDVDRLDEVRR